MKPHLWHEMYVCHMKCMSATCYHTTNTWNHTIYMHQHNNYVKLHHIHASTQQLHENTPSTCIHTTTTWNYTIHMNTQVRHFYLNSLEPQQSKHNLFGLYNFFNKSTKLACQQCWIPEPNPGGKSRSNSYLRYIRPYVRPFLAPHLVFLQSQSSSNH